MASNQVNVRIDPDLVRVLEAAAFVEGTSIGELVKSSVEDLARHFAENATVQLALRARAERAAEREGTLRSLSSRRKADTGDA